MEAPRRVTDVPHRGGRVGIAAEREERRQREPRPQPSPPSPSPSHPRSRREERVDGALRLEPDVLPQERPPLRLGEAAEAGRVPVVVQIPLRGHVHPQLQAGERYEVRPPRVSPHFGARPHRGHERVRVAGDRNRVARAGAVRPGEARMPPQPRRAHPQPADGALARAEGVVDVRGVGRGPSAAQVALPRAVRVGAGQREGVQQVAQ